MSDVLMLNKKRSIICSLIPESPIGSPSTSRSEEHTSELQ